MGLEENEAEWVRRVVWLSREIIINLNREVKGKQSFSFSALIPSDNPGKVKSQEF